MNIELDSIPLIWEERDQKGGVTDIRNVSNISTSDRRSMVEHEIPGMEGNAFQNLGRAPVKISFEGSLQGRTAKTNLETLRSKFKQGIPLPLNSDISGATDVTKVLIEDLHIQDVPGAVSRYEYSIKLSEYKEPPPEPKAPLSQEQQAKEWAKEVAEDATESLNIVTGKVLDFEGNPKGEVSVNIKGTDSEYSVQTNEDGIYRLENLPPGRYKITVDLEGYEGVEESVVIGNGGEKSEGQPPEDET
jgi:hypothetical protein